MPNYPSSFINGIAPGERTVNNVTTGLELKNTTVDTPGVGPYPTDQEMGTTDLVGSTQQNEDFNTLIAALATAIGAYQTAFAACSTEEKAYIAAHLSRPQNDLSGHFQSALYHIAKLTADVTETNTVGTLGDSRYPSGRNRGF